MRDKMGNLKKKTAKNLSCFSTKVVILIERKNSDLGECFREKSIVSKNEKKNKY